MTKAMRLARPEPVTTFRFNGFDWFNDPQKGLARTLVDDQEASGRFPGTVNIQDQLRSAWGVIILSRTLFVQPPVADAGRDLVWAVDVPRSFDGSGSYHLDPFRRIVKYDWDFDGDGVFDSSSDQPTATYTFTSQKYPNLPVTITSILRVTDNNVPPLTATDTVQTIVAVPPHPPIAEPGGPYTCTAGLPCPLDGSQSHDLDPTDFITRYEWELDGIFPFDFDEASGSTPTYIWTTARTYNIGLRVWDNGVLNDLNGNGQVDENERLSDQHFTTVRVEANLPPVANAGGPYTVTEGSSVTLDGSQSSDPNGDPLQYTWDFDNDGQFDDASGVAPSFAGVDDGVYTVRLRVSDGLLDNEAATTVTVTNVAPTVDAGPNQTVTEGATVNFSGSFTDPGAQDTHTLLWDFGDGNSASGSLTPTHVYANEGTYQVTLTVTDDDGGTGSDTLTLTVQNAAPTVQAGPDQTVTEGDTVTVTASFTDPGVTDTHTATIDWGDGSAVTDATVNETNGSGTATASHLYPDNGVFTVTMTVRDNGGASRSDTLQVTVQNALPVVDAGSDQAAKVNETVSLPPATFTDRGVRDTHTARIDWGDGAVEDGVVTESNGSGSVAGSHAYNQAGLYTVTVTVTDKDGGVGSDALQVNVTVGNEPPEAVVGGPYTVNEGGSITLDGSGSHDPNNDPLSYAWDLDGDGQFDDGSTATVSFSRPDNGVYPVMLRVADAEFSDTDQTTVTVINVAPMVIPGPNQSVTLGVPVQLTQTRFTDPGVLDTHTARIDWGDGAVEDGVVTESNGSGGVAGSHPYTAVGTYTVLVTVTDDDGGTGMDSLTVTVQQGPEQTIDDLQARLKADKVELRWTPVTGAEGYTLYRRTESGAYTKLTDKAACATCVHVDFGLAVGVKYYYVVTSWSGRVESLYSNEVSVTGQTLRGR